MAIIKIYQRNTVDWAVTDTGQVYEIFNDKDSQFSGQIIHNKIFSYPRIRKDLIDVMARSYGFKLIKTFRQGGRRYANTK